jgi:hypothetical protein
MIINEKVYLNHHGVKGMHWGIRNSWSNKKPVPSDPRDNFEVTLSGESRARLMLASVGKMTLGTPIIYQPGRIGKFLSTKHHIVRRVRNSKSKIHLGKVTTDNIIGSAHVSYRTLKFASKQVNKVREAS